MVLLIPLARAESADSTLSNLTTVLACGGIGVGVLVVAIVPVMIGWSRRHRHAEALAAVAILWGLIATISLCKTTLDQMNYSRQHLADIESGYWDPNDTSDARPLPLATWTALGVGYLALLAWPFLSARRSISTVAAHQEGEPL